MKYFTWYTRQDLASLTRLRRFETKLGERLQVIGDPQQWESALQQSSARYVLLGICEDIGVRGNDGIPGSATAWQSFLAAFCNLQSNDFLSGEELLLAGSFDFSEMTALIEQNAQGPEEKITAWRHAVVTIDDAVEELVRVIALHGKIPVVIGGGHNNAYPLIKGVAKGLYKAEQLPLAQINCINLDAHTDYRPIEGRHSGNAFRYAEEDGYLQKYCVIGMHENYLPQNIWIDIVNNPFIDLRFLRRYFLCGRKEVFCPQPGARGRFLLMILIPALNSIWIVLRTPYRAPILLPA
jgi:Arginase/agmatinase/formimionoglutamate hydrolase, arginase family